MICSCIPFYHVLPCFTLRLKPQSAVAKKVVESGTPRPQGPKSIWQGPGAKRSCKSGTKAKKPARIAAAAREFRDAQKKTAFSGAFDEQKRAKHKGAIGKSSRAEKFSIDTYWYTKKKHPNSFWTQDLESHVIWRKTEEIERTLWRNAFRDI